MTKSATRVAADKVTFTQAEVTSAVALKAPIATPVFTGNVGVGVTPEAWSSNNPALQIGSGGVLYSHVSNGTRVSLQGNAYVNSSNADAYITTNEASQHIQEDGTHLFKVAPSGTADAAISWNTAMSIDNAGIVTKPLQPAFSVSVNSYSGINCAPQSHLIRFGEQSSGAGLFNNGNYFDTTNRRFVAPVSGFYQFNVHIRMDGTSGDYVYLTMVRNGSTNLGRDLDVGVGSYVNRSISVVASLSANDYVDCNARTSGDTSIGIDGDSWFSGHLIG